MYLINLPENKVDETLKIMSNNELIHAKEELMNTYIKRESSMNIGFATKIYALLLKVANQLHINHEATMVAFRTK